MAALIIHKTKAYLKCPTLPLQSCPSHNHSQSCPSQNHINPRYRMSATLPLKVSTLLLSHTISTVYTYTSGLSLTPL
jgi:hypothetical protein